MRHKKKNLILSMTMASIVMMPIFANASPFMAFGHNNRDKLEEMERNIRLYNENQSMSRDQLINGRQMELSEDCGVHIFDLKKDVSFKQDSFIQDINIINNACDIEVTHFADNKAKKAKTFIQAQDFIVMLAEVSDRNKGLTTTNEAYNTSLRRKGITYLLKDYIESSESEKRRLAKLFHKRFSRDLKSRRNAVTMTKYIDDQGRSSMIYLENSFDKSS